MPPAQEKNCYRENKERLEALVDEKFKFYMNFFRQSGQGFASKAVSRSNADTGPSIEKTGRLELAMSL